MSTERIWMHPAAQAALTAAEKMADMRVVIVQTEGHAPESKGTHEVDGDYEVNDHKHGYAAAIDFSVNQHATRLSDGHSIAMDEKHIRWWLHCLAAHGFVAWYRRKSQGFSGEHIHGVFAGVKMKPMLQAQVQDYLNGRTGLKSHAEETFWLASDEDDAKIRALFEAAN